MSDSESIGVGPSAILELDKESTALASQHKPTATDRANVTLTSTTFHQLPGLFDIRFMIAHRLLSLRYLDD